MTNKTKEKYRKLIRGSKMTKQDILDVKKRLNAMRFEKNIESLHFSSVLESWFRYKVTKEHGITKEHSKLGITYLKNYFFKLNGNPRKNIEIEYNNIVLEIVKNFSKFKFVGYYEYNGDYNTKWFEQVWRVYSKSGAYFDYTCGHWCKIDILYYKEKNNETNYK